MMHADVGTSLLMEFCGMWVEQDQRDVCDSDMLFKKCVESMQSVCNDGILLDVATDRVSSLFFTMRISSAA